MSFAQRHTNYHLYYTWLLLSHYTQNLIYNSANIALCYFH